MITNEELVKQALAGDQDAYTELYNRLLPIMTRVTYKKMFDHPDRDDLPSEILAHIFLRLDKFKGESKLTSWCTRIAINFCYQRYREKKKKLAREISLETIVAGEAGSGITLEDIVASERNDYAAIEARIDVERVMRRLAPGYRHALHDRFILGKDHNEIVEASSGITTVGGSKSQQSKGIVRARTIMEDMTNYDESNNYQLPDAQIQNTGIAVVVKDKDEINKEKPLIGRKPVKKNCRCCGEEFYTTSYAQIFISGHKIATEKPTVKKPTYDKVSQEIAVALNEDLNKEMTSIRIPVSALDKLISLMPVSMKRAAVEQFLGSM